MKGSAQSLAANPDFLRRAGHEQVQRRPGNIKKRSKYGGLKSGFCSHSTRTSCYGFKSEYGFCRSLLPACLRSGVMPGAAATSAARRCTPACFSTAGFWGRKKHPPVTPSTPGSWAVSALSEARLPATFTMSAWRLPRRKRRSSSGSMWSDSFTRICTWPPCACGALLHGKS